MKLNTNIYQMSRHCW